MVPYCSHGQSAIKEIEQSSFEETDKFTTTMRAYASPHHILQSHFIDQTTQSMKRSPSLECANPLLVLAFEEQLHFGPRGGMISISIGRTVGSMEFPRTV